MIRHNKTLVYFFKKQEAPHEPEHVGGGSNIIFNITLVTSLLYKKNTTSCTWNRRMPAYQLCNFDIHFWTLFAEG